MLLASVLTLIVALLIGKVFVPVITLFRRSLSMSKMASSPRGHWFYGHLKQYSQTTTGLLGFVKDIRKFPALFNYWIGPFFSLTQAIHPDINKVVLSSNTPKARFVYDFVRPWVGDGLLTSEGKKWKRQRKLITPAFHFNILKQYTKTFNDCADVMLDKFSGMTSQSIEVSSHLNLLTLDAILRCAYSSDTGCQLDSIKNNEYVQAVHSVAECIVGRIDNPLLQLSFFYKLSSIGRKFYRSVEVLHNNTARIIKERKEENEKKKYSDDEKKFVDFLDMLLKAKDNSGKGLTDIEIRDEVETFLFEGHDTTSSGLAWLFYNLARHPDIQEKCRNEVNDVLGDHEGKIKTEHLPKLSYLTMCIKESLRLHSPVYVIGRTLDEDLPVECPLLREKHSTLPNESNIMVNIFAQHKNPLIWENADVYDPERFSDENISKMPPHAFIPFSAGPRNCIGQNFAMNEMKVVMSATLRRFKLTVDESKPAPQLVPKLVLRSSTGVHIKFEQL